MGGASGPTATARASAPGSPSPCPPSRTQPAARRAGAASGAAGGPGAVAVRSTRQAHRDSENNRRVLAVDDNPNDLWYVRDALVQADYVPIITGNPEEVVDLVEHERPDLVLLDLMLPGCDGMELMRDILDVADVPVVFLSAYGRDDVIARALEMGAVDYVVKPFSATELAARIKSALRRRVTVEPSQPYVLGDLTIDYARRRASLAGRRLRLTPTEYAMLAELSAPRRTGADPPAPAGEGLGGEAPSQPEAHAHHGQQAAAQARRPRRQPHLHLHRAPRRLPDAQGRDRRDGRDRRAARSRQR